jgi:hypothetical protein
MKNKQVAKLKMFNMVVGAMKKYQLSFQEIPELNKSFEILVENTVKVSSLAKDQEKDLSPISVEKSETKIALINIAVPISNIIIAYAFDIKDKSYKKKVSFSRNKLVKAKDQAVLENCMEIAKSARKLFAEVSSGKGKKDKKPSITLYGLSGQLIDDLEKNIERFQSSLLEQKNAIANRTRCTKELKETFSETESLMNNKIDRLMTIYEIKNATLYKEYVSARVLESVVDDKKIAAVKTTPIKAPAKPVVSTSSSKTVASKAPVKTAVTKAVASKTPTQENTVAKKNSTTTATTAATTATVAKAKPSVENKNSNSTASNKTV